jgi:hypothetical protein
VNDVWKLSEIQHEGLLNHLHLQTERLKKENQEESKENQERKENLEERKENLKRDNIYL